MYQITQHESLHIELSYTARGLVQIGLILIQPAIGYIGDISRALLQLHTMHTHTHTHTETHPSINQAYSIIPGLQSTEIFATSATKGFFYTKSHDVS